MILDETLKLLDLTEKEVRLMLAFYKVGAVKVGEASRQTHMPRATAYLLAGQLVEKGLLVQELDGRKKRLVAVDPGTLLRMLAAKQRTLRRKEIELEEKLPELMENLGVGGGIPRVRVYSGGTGLRAVMADILGASGEILLWTNQEIETWFFTKKDHEDFVAERVKKGMKIRVLAVDNKQGRELKSLDKEVLRETRMLPKDITFSTEMYIYDGKMAMLDFNQDVIGVIVESKPLVSSQRSIFEALWKHL